MQTNNLSPAKTRFLTRADAANYVRTTYGFPCSRQWLAKLAVIGGGPIYCKAGRTPLYAPADLDAWAEARIGGRQRSTSDMKSSAIRPSTTTRPSESDDRQRATKAEDIVASADGGSRHER